MALLTKGNWKSAAVKAGENLPTDLVSSVGHKVLGDDFVIVTVAVNPIPEDKEGGYVDETSVNEIEIRFWESERQEYEMKREKWEQLGCNAPIGPQADWPLITTYSQTSGVQNGYYVGHATTTHLMREIQKLILNESVPPLVPEFSPFR
jgi:hypothetical protein